MQDRTSDIKLNLRLLPPAVLLFGLAYLLSNDRPWLVLTVGLGATWGLGYLWSRQLARALRVEREVDLVWASVGDFVNEVLRLVNDSRLPATWVQVVDRSEMIPEPFNVVASVPGRAPSTRRLNHLCDRRGLFLLGPTTLHTGDPLGVFTVTIADAQANSVMITPPTLPLGHVRVPSGGWGGEQERRRSLIERSISEAGVRPYVAGDSLRRIHWPATARHDELVVRELEATSAGDWWIFADLNGPAQAGAGRDSTLELTVVLAASFAARGLREGRRVGLSLAGPELTWLKPSSASTQRWRVLRTLAAAQAGARSLAELLWLAEPQTAQLATLIVISADPNPAWVAALRQRSEGGSALAALVDPLSFGGSEGLAGVARALDRSRISHVNFSAESLTAAYRPKAAGAPGRRGGSQGRKFLRKGGAGWQAAE